MSILGSSKPVLGTDNPAFFTFETLVICFSVWLSHRLAWSFNTASDMVVWSMLVPMAAVVIVVQVTFYYNGLYERKSFTAVEAVVKVSASLIIASGILTVSYYALPAIKIGRSNFAITFTACAVLLCTARLCQIYFSRNGRFSQRIIIVGTGSRAMEVARLIAQKKGSGYTLLGFVESDQEWTARKMRASAQSTPVLTLLTGSEPRADEREKKTGDVLDPKRRWVWAKKSKQPVS